MVSILSNAPKFTAFAVENGKFVSFDSESLQGGWSVLFFYPRDFSYVCPSEIMELSRRIPDFEALKTKVVGISCDSEFSHRSWSREMGGVKFLLVADFEKTVANAFGVLLEGGFPARATFILDDKGVIRHITVNAPEVGRSIAELLRTLEALQLGALTPAEWHRGEPVIDGDEMPFDESL